MHTSFMGCPGFHGFLDAVIINSRSGARAVRLNHHFFLAPNSEDDAQPPPPQKKHVRTEKKLCLQTKSLMNQQYLDLLVQ